MKNSRKFLYLFVFILMISCKSQQESRSILAKVGEAYLTTEQVSHSIGARDSTDMSAEDLENYIHRWIDEELLYQAGVAEGIASSPEIQDELRKIRRMLIINRYLNNKLHGKQEFSDESLNQYYETHKEDFIRDQNEYRYSFLICKDRKAALSILRDIRRDSSFNRMIETHYPHDVLNKSWDSGYVTSNQIIPVLQKIMVQLRPGSSYGPVASESGLIIFRLEEKFKSGTIREMELVKEILKQRVQEEWYREQYQQLLVSLRNKKPVEIHLLGIGTQTTVSDSTK
jgi:parvulin-like peptidyl-prolyl isomerase